MIYDQYLCYNAGAHNVYFNLSVKDLEYFNFPPGTKQELIERSIDGNVSFMVYDNDFR